MARSRRFISEMEVSAALLADDTVAIRGVIHQKLNEMTEATGPRGGRYELGPVTYWTEHEDMFFRPVVYVRGHRQGTYVRPAHTANSPRSV